jgi:hypothetical protein
MEETKPEGNACGKFIIFLLFVMITLLINMDHGSIPAATVQIGEDFNLSKV